MGDNSAYNSGASHQVKAGCTHILAYTDDVKEHPQMAATRKREIERSAFYEKGRDAIYTLELSDLGLLKGKVRRVVNESKKAGRTTVEFAIWSHSALDGPIGSKPTSRGAPIEGLGNQLSLDEWMAIDFNWHPYHSFASFYGCRSSMRYNKSHAKSFALRFLKRSDGLFAAAGQPWFTCPSLSFNERIGNVLMDYPENANLYSVAALAMTQEDGSRNWWELDEAVKARTVGIPGFKLRLFYRKKDGSYGVMRRFPNIDVVDVLNLSLVHA